MNRIFSSFLLFLFCAVSYGQSFRFNQYTTEDGISQNFIYSINQDKNGYLWVGTGEGLCRFDGKNFYTYTTDQGLAENVITCSYVDEIGTQWIGHNGGQISKFENGKFSVIPNDKAIQSKINAISGNGNGVFFVAQNEGVFQIKDGKTISLGNFNEDSFHALYVFDENNIAAGTSSGLIHIQNIKGKWTVAKKVFEDEWINTINPTHEEGIAIIGSQSGLMAKIRLNEGTLQKSLWDSEIDLGNISLQYIMEDDQQNIWLATQGQGLIKLKADTTGAENFEMIRYNKQTGMSSDFVQTVFQDREHNIWIGTFGQGLSTLLDDYFTFYNNEQYGANNNVSSIWIDDSNKWLGLENGLLRISDQLENGWQLYNSKNSFVNDAVTTLFVMDSKLWIGTRTSGMYCYDLTNNKITAIQWGYGGLQKRINQISGKEGVLWVATDGGLIVYNIKNKSNNLFDTESGLAHNAIKTVLLDDEGNIWMGTHSRFVYKIVDYSIEEYEIIGAGELEIVSICQDLEKNIWLATSEKGVYKKVGKSFSHFTTENGLKSNYCYSVHADANNNIWIGHRGALSKILQPSNEILGFDHKSGVEGQVNPNAMFRDGSNYLWIGTDKGAIQYDPTKDVANDIPPVINLISVTIGDKLYDINHDIELPYGNYRVQFEFIGVSFKDPEKVVYQYMLEGHDEVYSDFSPEASATYGKITDGKYSFKIKACNADGICAEKTAVIKINVKAPFWKKWWFYVLVAIVLISIIFLGVRWRLQRMRKIQEYLEKQLAIKTKEVVEKAEHIEEINKDLTSSINYAQRIQSSILPEIEELTDLLPGSYIFYKPRDIVSGDFYFIRQIEEKLIIGCVDCTGHGVPGAFVSMIGSTTLRNIYMLMESSGKWLKPNDVLEILDSEVQKILHQEQNAELDIEESFFKSRDGMDLTLVEVDLKTKQVDLASAKRHSFIHQDGKVALISGDKVSIGGGDVDKKDFNLQSYQMNTGDVLYLFSDGFPDQFGGDDGRKLKLGGVQKLIQDMSDQNVKDPSEYIDQVWTNWKGGYEQIDDVLFMAIQF
ncbi:MAG: two-component regulator propeller domain-containing protein [Crocinitomicaceae bacterium]|nr:SpoIIE family protein phosphatase [Crocinitomicaceae bacterium]